MASRTFRVARIGGLALGLASRAAFAQPIITNWTGPANGLWSSAGNWDPGTAPSNLPPFPVFDVRITGGGSPVIHDMGTLAVPNQISLLTLGDNRLLTVPAGRALTVLGSCTICGSINTNGGVLLAPNGSFSCGRSTLSVAAGGMIAIDAPSYSAAGLLAPATILSAVGTGSVLDLRSVTSISDAWAACCSSFEHKISASSGGLIDLRAAETLTGPGDDEYLTITVATGGIIDLSSLATISGSGNGRTYFVINDPSTLVLPSIQSLGRTICSVSGGGELHAAGMAPSSYNSSGMNYPATILSAAGAGSILDLRSVTSINDAWAACCSSFEHKITASGGGLIDLRAVQTITGPGDDDYLTITVATGGTIDLSAVTTVSGSGNGRTYFVVSDPSTLVLPSIQSLGRTICSVSGGGELHAAGTAPSSFDSSGMNYPATILSAAGAGSILDLRSITSINDAWAACCSSFEHKISASAGGLVDLRAVQAITGPGDDDYLTISVSSGGVIDLSGLQSFLHGGSNGRINVGATSGGRIDLGNASINTGMSFSVNDSGSILHCAGLRVGAGPGAAIALGSAGSRLEIAGSLQLGSPPPPALATIALTTAPGSTVTVGQDLIFTQTTEDQVKLDKATVQFDGSGPQRCEVGGLDLGPNGACLLPNGNFGIGQLIVGKTGQPTTLRLSDLIDNGNRAGRAEALYLWGSFDRGNPPTTPCGPTSPQIDGLRILAGSTLILDGVNVYTFQNGQWKHLNCLFSSTVNHVAFDGGFIERAGCYANCDNSTTSPVLNVNDFVCFNNRFAEGNCYANCDGSSIDPVLNVNDFICFINRFAVGCP